MKNKTIKVLLPLMRYAAIAVFAFWLGLEQADSSKDKIEPDSGKVTLADDSANQLDLKNEVARLTHDLEQAQQSNHELKTQLTSAAALIPPVAMESENDRRCGLLSEKLDLSLYEEAYQGIYSTDFATRGKSLKALAQLETPEAKATLLNVVMDERENTSLRRDLIRAMDWHGAIGQATSLLSSKHESVKAAVILAAQDSHLNETEQEDFQRELMGVFNENSGDFIQIAAIDYLANKNPAKISEITALSKDTDVSARVNQHIDELLQSSFFNNTKN